ncbi:MAG: hypothetical protein EBZ77_09945, partial [Chitinophagia bacterium]|nr:hypothetical protein [Chitinophagia bacterium]
MYKCKQILLLGIVFLSLSVAVHAQSKLPFVVPPYLVPGWAYEVDWAHLNVLRIDSLLRVHSAELKEANEAPNNHFTARDNQEQEENPFVTAYIRWRNKMTPFIQRDGSVVVDKNYYRNMLEQSATGSLRPVRAKTTAAANWHLLGP